MLINLNGSKWFAYKSGMEPLIWSRLYSFLLKNKEKA